MTFREVLSQVIGWLQHDRRVSYRALKREFNLDDNFIEDLKEDILYAHPVTDDKGRGLMWTGDTTSTSSPDQSMSQGNETESRFQALLPTVIALLRSEGRVTYRTLAYAFDLDDRLLTDIRKELQFRRLAIDEGGEGLVWTGQSQPSVQPAVSEPSQKVTREVEGVLPHESAVVPEPTRSAPDAERRQLTVMFCDLVGSTDLSRRLDAEDLREVVQAYQETAAKVIQQYDGHIAQYLGDGLLIYFGWPQAHENDAERAVYTGLEIPQAIDKLNRRLDTDYGVKLAVRIGIHTGPVVVGEMGGGERHENLALGETVNISARLEGLAKPNTVVISPATAQLVQRSFVQEELGRHELKGVAEPMMLYAVVGPRDTEDDDHEQMLSGGFDALVGRGEEIGLLLRRWEQSKEGQGQVVLISGEAGLGKSSLVEGLRAHVRQEGYTRITFRCSPYTANSAMHPVIEHVQRVLGWQREDSTETKLDKLKQAIQSTNLPVDETVPLFAALLSLSIPEDRYPALTLSPQRQRQLTQDTLVAWMLEEAERQPVLAVWEDLHWADPSTLELLGLFIEQTPTVSMMNVLAYRPEFVPPWSMQSHMTSLTLNRLERIHIEALVHRLAGSKKLPTELVEHIVGKTDGVPLYVEELTKMLLESNLLQKEAEQYVLTGSLSSASIPATLQDSLMARLDSLPTVKQVAQLGSVLGREFDYEMIEGLAVMDESTLQAGLSQLVAHELLYQRGRIPRAKFIFRHALIRDAAYASLLRRTRQQYHQRIAQTLEARFSETAEAQPELLAHHFTEGDLSKQAIGYWQQASERAFQNSNYIETLAHLTKGLEILPTLSDTDGRARYELRMQITRGLVLTHTKGHASAEVGDAYTRARELCHKVGDKQQLASILAGLRRFYLMRAEYRTARDVGQELLHFAQEQDDVIILLWGHFGIGAPLFALAEFSAARQHLEQGVSLYDPAFHQTLIAHYGADLGVICRSWGALSLWHLGYPMQALQRGQEAILLAQDLSHPFSLALGLSFGLHLHQLCGDVDWVLEQVEVLASLAGVHNQEFIFQANVFRNWGLVLKGHGEQSISQMHHELKIRNESETRSNFSYHLSLLAQAYGKIGDCKQGIQLLTEALTNAEKTGEKHHEAEIHRLKGQLLLQQSPDNTPEAESYFQKAISIAQTQSAKSWELRAATSLARLWQNQGKVAEACELLSPVYAWFTEGFDTADLIDAKVLLDELA